MSDLSNSTTMSEGWAPVWKQTEGWEPPVALDLHAATQPEFLKVMERIAKEVKTFVKTAPPLELVNGWYTITPETAWELLLRNVRNRKPSRATARYYLDMMAGNFLEAYRTGHSARYEGLCRMGSTACWRRSSAMSAL